MPIHDWTRVTAGDYHDFHQDWTIELRRRLNAGLLPPGYRALTDQRIEGREPETEAGGYARRANRLLIQKNDRTVIAVIEIVSPGNKDRGHSVNQFVERLRKFISNGVHILFVDVFPPGAYDPDGLDATIRFVRNDYRAEKPLIVASYDVGDPFAADIEPLAVGDPLPEMPLFLQPGAYIPCPLDDSYQAAWNALPAQLRDAVSPPA